MDWYSWLSKAGLTPSVTYEYGLLFNQNELVPGDAAHFDHDLLKSMGIAVAKHRLEILKLARKDAGATSNAASYARFVRKAGKCLARCVRWLALRGGRGSSVTFVPRICNGDDVRVGAVQRRSCNGDDVRVGAVQRRNVKKMVLMITHGAGAGERGGRFSASPKASLIFHDCCEDDKEEDGAGGGEIKWDSMFQDLKPT